MKIRITENCYKSKDEAKKLDKKTQWSEFDGNYFDVVNLYQKGHTINISDEEVTDTLILDLDTLTNEQAEKLQDVFYIMELVELLDVERIDVLPSSSNNKNKRKVFIQTKTPMIREIEDNIDLSYQKFIENFEIQTEMICDKSMCKFTQITFGIYLNDFQYNSTLDRFNERVPSTQPKKIEVKKVFEKPSEYISANMFEYNQKYGKAIRYIPRLEWNTYKFGGVKPERIIITNGKRNRTIGKLVKTITFNALIQNNEFHTSFTKEDVENKVFAVIGNSFQDYKNFIRTDGKNIKQQIHNEWKRANEMEINSYYEIVCEEMKVTKKFIYTPRTESIKALFNENIIFFKTCKDTDIVFQQIGYLCEGDEKMIERMYKYYKQIGNTNRKTRNDKGLSKYHYILENLIDSTYNYTTYNSKEHNFCKKRKISYKAIK